MVSFPKRHARALAWTGGGLLLLIVLLCLGVSLLPQRMAPYIAGEVFRGKLSESTSRGLKVEGQFTPLHPDGWEVTTASFRGKARPGESIGSLEADGIAGRFNPWGVLRRRWELKWISLDHATITLRKSDPSAKIPLPVKKKPWYAFLLPKRVAIEEVRCEDADVLWTFRDQPSGIHHIRLLITPAGYKNWRFTSGDGSGLLEFPPLPPLRVADISATLSKPWFTLEEAILAPQDPADPGRLHLDGKAGLREDKTLALTLKIDRMPFAPWLPPEWRNWVGGRIEGKGTWDGTGTRLEGSRGEGDLRWTEATLTHLPLFDQLALFSGNPAFREIHLTRAALSWRWKDPVTDVSDLILEAPGLIRLDGWVHGENGSLSGTLRLGLRPADLKWLPQQGKTLFTEEKEGYRWVLINLAGTIQRPTEDFTPRLVTALLHSPDILLKLGWKELFPPAQKP